MKKIFNIIFNEKPIKQKDYFLQVFPFILVSIFITFFIPENYIASSLVSVISIIICTCLVIIASSAVYRRCLQLGVPLTYMLLLFFPLFNLIFPIILGLLNKEYINLITTKYNFKFISQMVIKHSVFYMFIAIVLLFIFPNFFTHFIETNIAGNIRIFIISFFLINLTSIFTEILLKKEKVLTKS